MKATPKRMRAIYTMLCQMPPFERWDLPPPHKIKFIILNDPEQHGHYWHSDDDSDRHEIALNVFKHITLQDHIMLVAHEMGHMRQARIGRLPDSIEQSKLHNSAWQRIARTICEALGFPVGDF